MESSDGPIAIVGACNSGTRLGSSLTAENRQEGLHRHRARNSRVCRGSAGGKGVSEPTRSHSAFPGPLDSADIRHGDVGDRSLRRPHGQGEGEPLPEGVAYGKDCGWTTDASEALEGGAIATLGAKGAGLPRPPARAARRRF